MIIVSPHTWFEKKKFGVGMWPKPFNFGHIACKQRGRKKLEFGQAAFTLCLSPLLTKKKSLFLGFIYLLLVREPTFMVIFQAVEDAVENAAEEAVDDAVDDAVEEGVEEAVTSTWKKKLVVFIVCKYTLNFQHAYGPLP